jgi:hypothetical protein
MQGHITAAVLGGFIMLMAMGVPAWARSNSDEARLETVKQEIDRTAATTPQETKIQALASQYNVDPGVVQSLHDKKPGWGETSIELAMAQHLTQTDPNTYPTMTNALNKIETLRSQKMGWGKIANTLGFKLGPVVSTAMHTRNELRREYQGQSSSRVQKDGQSGRTDQTDMAQGMGHPERLGRPERIARPERPERVH